MPLLGRAIDRFGARRVMVVVGIGFGAVLMGLSMVQGLAEGLVICATVIPLALLGLPRRTPAHDAEHAEPGARRNDRLPPVDWTLHEALRTPMFWVVASGVTMVSTLGTAAAFHQIALLGERGLSRTEAAANFLPQTVAGLAATLVLGYLADRLLLALGHDWLGGYRPALLVLALLPVGTIVVAAFVKPPPARPPSRAG